MRRDVHKLNIRVLKNQTRVQIFKTNTLLHICELGSSRSVIMCSSIRGSICAGNEQNEDVSIVGKKNEIY